MTESTDAGVQRIDEEEEFIKKMKGKVKGEEVRQAEIRQKRAYAIGDPDESRDFQIIYIPDGWQYYDHKVDRWTANPPVEPSVAEASHDWYIHEGVHRNNQQQIIAVWVEVWAASKAIFGARKWIGVDLKVTITK